MADSRKRSPSSRSPTSTSPVKPQAGGGRQRIISSCLTCRRRKVRCDHGHPVCGACTRGNHVCTYATDQGLGAVTSGNRITKPSWAGLKGVRTPDVQSRLDRLEILLEKAVASQGPVPHRQPQSNHHEPNEPVTPTSNSQSSHGAGMSSDNHDGTLLLEDGQSQFVSSLHWALMADEIQDIKALLGESEERSDQPTQSSLISLLSLGKAKTGVTLQALLPQTQQHCDALLDLFFYNVDPMIRVVHKPTLLRKFNYHLQACNPIVFAIFYSAINSLPPKAVEEKFGERKEALLERFEQGVEISLAREQYLTTSSLEVLQGFVIWLTCITKEDDMGKAWSLLGLAIRIALNQGLHRDPSLFPAGSMDSVTIEIRRRLWHQICHLEYRAAECKGQEPNISDDDFTTLLPRNINDDELIEGASPGPSSYDDDRFTDMTFQLVRFVGMRTLRRIVQSTYRLERRMLESGLLGTSAPDPVTELQGIYEQIKVMVDDMHEETRQKYLQHCNVDVPTQRLALGLASLLEWRCYLLFWLRMPRAYRDMVFSIDIRKSIFEKSINLVETLNGASVDVDAARFQWHIGGHASFQAIMHLLSELRNPTFDAPERQRALRALQMARILKETNTTKAWAVVKGMIEKVLAENSTPLKTHPASSFPSPTSVTSNPHQPAYAQQANMLPQVDYKQIVVDQMPAYATSQAPLQPQPQAPTHAPTQPQPLGEPFVEQPMPGFDWNLDLNNIVGGYPPIGQQGAPGVNTSAGMDIPDIQQTPGVEFNWGFWGDPVNLAPLDYQFPDDVPW